MSSSEYGESGSEDVSQLFLLHDAAAAGDAEALRQLLEGRVQHLQQQMETDAAEGESAGQALLGGKHDPYLQSKDAAECTPLHHAILGGHVECAKLLIDAQADVSADVDGCPCLHLAICTAALPGRQEAAAQLVTSLLDAGADPIQRDDSGRLALHWAAELGLAGVCQRLLEASASAATALAAQMAAAAEAGGEPLAELEPPNLLTMQDQQGDTALHAAARFDQLDALELLLSAEVAPAGAAAEAAACRNKAGLTPLAAAAYHGAAEAAALLLRAHPEAAGAEDPHGFAPAALAERRGHRRLAALLRTPPGDAEADAAGAVAAEGEPRRAPTLIVAPPECELHRTCPDPLPRHCTAPPENVERLRVLTAPGRGILRSRAFAGRLAWQTSVAPAPIGDVLRVHEWNYVRGLQLACQAIPDRPDALAHLDPDTAVSHHSFGAALRAAAAVCAAVDGVVRGAAANAFCAVRPPGHHAGPRGVVPSKKDSTGSHGFCLLNNVAVAAAYAMNVHRHAGIQRVAILDFDVHHGNGTRACVSNTAPGTLRVPFSTPLSEGVHVYRTYMPWLDADDDDNVLFASVQGYGPKAASMPDVFVYPGSGATCDTAQLKAQLAASQQHAAEGADGSGTEQQQQEAAAAVKAEGGAAAIKPEGGAAAADGPAGAGAGPAAAANGVPQATGLVEEDPEGEFPPSAADDPPLAGPRLIEVGVPGPGGHPLLWRRAWRDKVLPAVVNFGPDLILVSAGFDAHRKDEINFRYIGVTEADYEWLTDQIVQVANRCCSGRVVSVLEGGYNLNGGIASAFARSVAAHVRGLAEPQSQAWDPQEARIEREQERRRKEERAARIAAKRAAALARLAAAEAAEAGATGAGAEAEGKAAAAAAEGGAPAAAAEAPQEGGGRSKRRRTGSVDYAALNAQLEAEAAAAAAGGGAQGGADGGGAPA